MMQIPEKAEDAGEETNPEGLFRCWQEITPDIHHDWLNQRDDSFNNFMPIGNKKNGEKSIFENYSCGLKTNRDEWVWNFSEKKLEESIKMQVATYEEERARLNDLYPNVKTKEEKENRLKELKKSPNYNNHKISWTRGLRNDIVANKELNKEEGEIRYGMYRPFIKEKIFFSHRLNEMVLQLPKIFPIKEEGQEAKKYGNIQNKVICIPSAGGDFIALMVNSLPDLSLLNAAQCFPLYLYEEVENKKKDKERDKNTLFENFENNENNENKEENDEFAQESFIRKAGEEYVTTISGKIYHCKSGITQEALDYFKEFYKAKNKGILSDQMCHLAGEDIFYYIYALFHMDQYRTKYATSLSKELPRIPCVQKEEDFWKMSKIGIELAELHIDYEKQVEYFPINDNYNMELKPIPNEKIYYKVEKMRFDTKHNKETGKKEKDMSRIIYNEYITIKNIPLSVYNYKVNGKSAVEWVMDRLQITEGKRSMIKNDPNDWACEEKYDPAWPLKHLLKIIRVADQTNRLIKELKTIDF